MYLERFEQRDGLDNFYLLYNSTVSFTQLCSLFSIICITLKHSFFNMFETYDGWCRAIVTHKCLLKTALELCVVYVSVQLSWYM